MISSILSTLFQFYDVIFQPLLQLGPHLSLATFAVALAVLFSLIYWKFLDKEKADKIKEQINEKQEKLKEARENDASEKTQEHLADTLELNQKFMLVSMRPMLVTMIFVALIFPWLGATYSPTVPLQQIDNQTYEGNLTFGQQTEEFILTPHNESGAATVEVNGEEYETGERINTHGINWHVQEYDSDNGGILSTVEGPTVRFAAEFYKLPRSLPLVGEGLNWLAFYIILVMPLSIAIRKALGVA